MLSHTLGDFELSVFSDGTYPLDGGALFGVVPKIMWSRKVDSDERNYVQAGLNSLLVRTGKQNILVETGIGNKLSDKMRKIYGQPAQLLHQGDVIRAGDLELRVELLRGRPAAVVVGSRVVHIQAATRRSWDEAVDGFG